MNKKLSLVWPLLLLMTLTLTLMTAGAAAQEGTDAYIELLRSDVRADKQAIVTAAMELTDAESQAFWPIYREYETERTELGDRALDLIKRYAQNLESKTPETTRTLAAEWFKLQDDRNKLMKKYHGKVEKAMTPEIAMRWTQVEYRVWLLLQLQLASEIPLIEPVHQK
jgi:Spy/CpxP family protein refolding chaperone